MLLVMGWGTSLSLRPRPHPDDVNRPHVRTVNTGQVACEITCYGGGQVRCSHNGFVLPDTENDQVGLFLLGYLEDFLSRCAIPHCGSGFAPEFSLRCDQST
jgi:hypothetical protein